MADVTVVKHPLVQHKLSIMRDKKNLYRQLQDTSARDISAVVLRGHPRP